MLEIRTERLQLIALTLSQLGLYVAAAEQLEQELGLSISHGIVTDPLRRAIDIKLSKREKQHRFQPCTGEGRDAGIW